MADFDFDKWFQETYENQGAEKHSEYEGAPDKAFFKEKMIAREKVLREAVALGKDFSDLKDFGDGVNVTEENRQKRIDAIKNFLDSHRNDYISKYNTAEDIDDIRQSIIAALAADKDIAKSTFVNSYRMIERNYSLSRPVERKQKQQEEKPRQNKKDENKKDENKKDENKKDENKKEDKKEDKKDNGPVRDLRAHTSDQNQQRVTGINTQFLNGSEFPYSKYPFAVTSKDMGVGIDVAVLMNMEKLDDSFASLSPEEQDQKLKEVKLQVYSDPEERKKFHDLQLGATAQLVDTYPPQRLVDAAEWLTAAANQENDATQKTSYAKSLQIVLNAMKAKIHTLASGSTGVNQTNIADVYDGFMAMLKYIDRLPDNVKGENLDNLNKEIADCISKLDAEIKKYDQENGFENLSEKDADKIGDTYRRAVSLSGLDKEEKNGKFSAPAEFKNLWDNINVTDDNGQPITDAQKREEFINSFNEAAKKEAIRNVAVKHKGASKKELEEALGEELSNVYTEHLTKLLMTNEAGQGNTNPNMEEIIKIISEGKDSQGESKKYNLASKAGIAHFAQYTNDNMGYLHRLGQKIGTNAPALAQMATSVKKFDKTCITRFDPAYSQAKKFSRAVATSALWQTANMAARYGSQFIPGGNFVYAAYVAGTSSLRLWQRYKAQKKQAEAQGKKLKKWDFLKNSKTELANMAMLTAGAALGVQYLATAASAVAGLGGLYKGFKAARKNGDSNGKALLKSVTNLGTSLTAAAVAGFGLHLGGEAAGLTPYTGSAHNDTYDPDNAQVVTNPSDELKAMSPDELAKNGYHREICNPEDEGAFLVSEGKSEVTTHDYNLKTEHPYAEGRMGEPNSEFQAPESSHGLRHIDNDPNTLVKHGDPDNYYSHATSSLDALAKEHSEMNTYNSETKELVPNSEILAYKVYQLNHLVPNKDFVLEDLDGKPTAGDYYSYTDDSGNKFTYQDLEAKLANGDTLNNKDFELLMKIEQGVGMQNEGNVNSVGMVAYTGIDKFSYGHGEYVDPGFDENTRGETYAIHNRILETPQNNADSLVIGLTFLDYEGDRSQSLRDRIGANAGNTEHLTQQEKLSKEATDRLKDKFKRPEKPETTMHEEEKDKPVQELEGSEKKSWLKRKWEHLRDSFSKTDATVTATNSQENSTQQPHGTALTQEEIYRRSRDRDNR